MKIVYLLLLFFQRLDKRYSDYSDYEIVPKWLVFVFFIIGFIYFAKVINNDLEDSAKEVKLSPKEKEIREEKRKANRKAIEKRIKEDEEKEKNKEQRKEKLKLLGVKYRKNKKSFYFENANTDEKNLITIDRLARNFMWDRFSSSDKDSVLKKLKQDFKEIDIELYEEIKDLNYKQFLKVRKKFLLKVECYHCGNFNKIEYLVWDDVLGGYKCGGFGGC